MSDSIVQIAVYWFFALLLAGGALLAWADSGHGSHVAFAARQIGLTIVVSIVTLWDLPSALLIAVIAAMAANVLLYRPIVPRRR